MVHTRAAVEGASSVQRVVHSNSQDRLAHTRVNALMKVTFNWRIEATANAKAEERSSLTRTFKTTTDVTVEKVNNEDEESEEENHERRERRRLPGI